MKEGWSAKTTLTVKPNAELLAYNTLPFARIATAGALWDSDTSGPIVTHADPTLHGLVQAVDTAFSLHYPISFKPDDFLLPLIHSMGQQQAVGDTISLDVHQRTDACWSNVFASFSEQIRKHIGAEKAALFRGEFSTTTTMQAIAYDCALMDAYQSQFEYNTFSFCGIPSVTLQGTQDD